jgi:hypothetical protein
MISPRRDFWDRRRKAAIVAGRTKESRRLRPRDVDRLFHASRHSNPSGAIKVPKGRGLRLKSSRRAPWAAGCAGNKPVVEALGEQGLALDEGQR